MNNDIITYNDLIKLTLRIIKSKCVNINNKTISNFFKNGSTGTITEFKYN
jgi:hypothetical protein